ncbi:hypothetical protein GQ53DRAFT_681751 [Thozetella sp. PMI_491]|nr:hypothetical protein GQ53DRAFT_681751 [Thozetella sp. PMI_491]
MSTLQESPVRATRARAKFACRECHARRVRCDVTEVDPCSNCAAAHTSCELFPSRRGSDVQHEESSADVAAPNGEDDTKTTSTTAAAPTAQPANLFFGESNLITLVPRQQQLSAGDAADTTREAPMSIPLVDTPTPQLHAHVTQPAPFPRIGAVTERYLQDRGALTYPDLQRCSPVLQAYFKWCHPCFPVLDRADISQRFATGTISPILLHAMLFVGSTYCDDSVIKTMGFEDRFEAKRFYYTNARLLFHSDMEPDGTTLIQALFLLSFCRSTPSDIRDVRYWLGVVITLAESYGFHRLTRFTTRDPQVARMRRRIWWSIYASSVRERQSATSLGLPSRIRDEDCDIEPLDPTDLDFDNDCYEPIFSILQPEHVIYVMNMVELARLLGTAIDIHFAPSRRSVSTEQIETLSEALREWKESLPNCMKWGDEEDCPSVWKNLLHLAYNQLIILISRKHCLREVDSPEKDAAMRAANRISRIAENMLTEESLRYGQMHMITGFFSALCIHTITLRTAQGVGKTIAMHKARMCLLSLQEIQKYWMINNHLLGLFLCYLDESIAERLRNDESNSHAPPPDTATQEIRVSDGCHHSPLSPELPDDPGEGNETVPTSRVYHPFQQAWSGMGDMPVDLSTYLDSQYLVDDEIAFDGLDFLQRAL